jgi:hypothetical protein
MNSTLPRQEVVVTDIRMPFISMVMFMVKWAIASIPAMVILLVLGSFLWAVLINIPKTTKSLITANEAIPTNEASAIASVKEINEAEMIYASQHPDLGFTKALAVLGTPGAGTIDNSLASGRKRGYNFSYYPGEKIYGAIRSYWLIAVPAQVGTTGERRFYSDESGEIHYNAAGSADATSPVIQ